MVADENDATKRIAENNRAVLSDKKEYDSWETRSSLRSFTNTLLMALATAIGASMPSWVVPLAEWASRRFYVGGR